MPPSAVADALAALGILDLANRPIGALSGGQFQRVLFARLLLQDCRIILLDEPFRAVDAKTVADLILLVRRWHDEGRTVIAALHDIEQVRAHFDKTLLLAREVVAWGDTRTVLTPDNLTKGRHAVEVWEEHAGICERHDAVPGVTRSVAGSCPPRRGRSSARAWSPRAAYSATSRLIGTHVRQ